MGISKYPREGQRIAPKSLADLLHIRLANSRGPEIELSDLDETAWDRFKAPRCLELSDAVVAEVGPWLRLSSLRQQHLPPVPHWVRATDIDLGARTHNCLETAGLLQNPQALANRTIGEIIELPSFGARSLVDLLCALESFVMWLPVNGVPNAEITSLANKLARFPNLEQIQISDPRFKSLLRPLGMPGANATAVIQRIISRDVDPADPSLILRRLRKLKKRLGDVAQMTLEHELIDLTSLATSARNQQIAIKYFGWNGGIARTLESVGEEYGMTRERVRQLCEAVLLPLHVGRPYAPTLDRALKWIQRRLPAAATGLYPRMRAAHLLGSEFRFESIESAAKELGRDSTFRIESVAGTRVLVEPGNEGDLGMLLDLARKSISRWGAATIEDLSAQIESLGQTVSSDKIARLLGLTSDFRWLDEKSGWFWLSSTPRNSLLTQIKKIFAVVDRITLADLRAGVSRHHRRKGFAPPRRVLAELCAQLQWCRMSGDWVSARPQPKPNDVLSATELLMVEMLNGNGNIMEREKFERLCLEQGMKQVTFYAYLAYSPIIERFARGVYGLRGRPVAPGEVEAMKPLTRRAGRVLVDYGWTKDQHVLLIYRLSAGMISNGVASIPAAMRQTVEGKYQLNADDDSRLGTFVVGKSAGWGLLPFFRRRGGDVGDYLSIDFDLNSASATVRLGDFTICEELTDAAVSSP